MSKCGFCNAELQDNDPTCKYCNMYNKSQMLENEHTSKTTGKLTIKEEKQIAFNTAIYNKAAISSIALLFLGITLTIYDLYQNIIGYDDSASFVLLISIVFLGIPLTIISLRNSNYILAIDKNNKDGQSCTIRAITGFSLILCHNIIGIILAIVIYFYMKLLYNTKKR